MPWVSWFASNSDADDGNCSEENNTVFNYVSDATGGNCREENNKVFNNVLEDDRVVSTIKMSMSSAL